MMRVIYRSSKLIIPLIAVVITTLFIKLIFKTLRNRNWRFSNKADHFANVITPNPNNIFFIETYGKPNFDERQLCSVESAALVNRRSNVYALTQSEIQDDLHFTLMSIYKNVKFLHYKPFEMVKGSKLQELFDNGKLNKSNHYITDLSDTLRPIVIYKYGGTYMDLDFIALKPFPPVYEDPNFIGLESINWRGLINGAVFRFAYPGNDFLYQLIQRVVSGFNGRHWAHNGPYAITRTWRQICPLKNASLIDEDYKKIHITEYDCKGITLHPTHVFYPIHWSGKRNLFRESGWYHIERRVKQAILLHIWNNLTKGFKVESGDPNMPYYAIAKLFCPFTYRHLMEPKFPKKSKSKN